MTKFLLRIFVLDDKSVATKLLMLFICPCPFSLSCLRKDSIVMSFSSFLSMSSFGASMFSKEIDVSSLVFISGVSSVGGGFDAGWCVEREA